MISFMYFNLIYIDSHEKSLEKIPIAVRSVTTIFDMAEKILDIENSHLCFYSLKTVQELTIKNI